jgi:hypothetical protein
MVSTCRGASVFDAVPRVMQPPALAHPAGLVFTPTIPPGITPKVSDPAASTACAGLRAAALARTNASIEATELSGMAARVKG